MSDQPIAEDGRDDALLEALFAVPGPAAQESEGFDLHNGLRRFTTWMAEHAPPATDSADPAAERSRAAMNQSCTEPAEAVRIEAPALGLASNEAAAARPRTERTPARVGAPTRAFRPQTLPASIRSLSCKPPVPAPRGTLFVLGPEGGYAVPPVKYTLRFGRNRGEVHVPVGADDATVSDVHGVFTCTGPDDGWWLRNTGRLPIELPDGVLMLTGHRRIIGPGYTPLMIISSRRRSHLLEIRLIDGLDLRPSTTTSAPTADQETGYELSSQERLVLTALAKRYLEGHERYPLPLSWEGTAKLASSSPYATRTWSTRTAAHTVEDVRERLHRRGVPGLVREELSEPVGTMLNVNLIRELLKTATLTPDDLVLLAEGGD